MSTSKIDVLGAVASGNVGFNQIAVIFSAVRELAERNQSLAARLASVGEFMADDLAFKLDKAQDVIEEARDARLLRKLAKGKAKGAQHERR